MTFLAHYIHEFSPASLLKLNTGNLTDQNTNVFLNVALFFLKVTLQKILFNVIFVLKLDNFSIIPELAMINSGELISFLKELLKATECEVSYAFKAMVTIMLKMLLVLRNF